MHVLLLQKFVHTHVMVVFVVRMCHVILKIATTTLHEQEQEEHH